VLKIFSEASGVKNVKKKDYFGRNRNHKSALKNLPKYKTDGELLHFQQNIFSEIVKILKICF
jgi:hypothetical protein